MDLEKRFGHLLKPIRCLAKNWEINIASELEDYLEQIDAISITFDNGATSMNFAEAAMVIQGSTCVYSKKVEYLYSMVYTVLDLISSKKKLAAVGTGGDGAGDGDTMEADDQEEEFLVLDDVKTHDNINMKEQEKGVTSLVCIPMIMTKLDEAEKGDNPLVSIHGEVLANIFDFKLNQSISQRSSILVLDLSHLSLLEASIMHKPCSTPFVPPPKSRLAEDPPLFPTLVAEDEPSSDEATLIDIPMDDDDDAPPDLGTPEQPPPPPPPDKFVRRELRRRQERISLAPILAPLKCKVDPMRILDPHDPVPKVVEKPFKKVKTFKIPLGLEPQLTKKRKRKKEELRPLKPICDVYNIMAPRIPNNPLKVPFPEYLHLFLNEVKRRQRQQRCFRKQLMLQGRMDEVPTNEVDENDDPELQTGGNNTDDDDNPGPDLEMPDPMDELNASSMAGGAVCLTYEELVQQHVDGFMKDAQQYQQTTEIMRQVAEWQTRIVPALEEEETHEGFDIHLCGSRVLDKFTTSNSENITFGDVIEGQEKYQVCRLLLATLQLANTYNVDIKPLEPQDETAESIGLTFLSGVRHHEQLNDYQAPSVK